MPLKLGKNFSQGAFLVATLVMANFLNFLFSAVVGRTLSFEDFGILTLLNTLAFFLLIPVNSLSGAVNYKTAYLYGAQKHAESLQFFKRMEKKIFLFALIAAGMWLFAAPLGKNFFHLASISYLIYFSPAVVLGILSAVYKGFLHGIFKFSNIALLVLVESASKLLLAIPLLALGLKQWVYLAIPFSLIATCAVAYQLARRARGQLAEKTDGREGTPEPFPMGLFWASLLSGTSAALFLNLDVLLAKHYLDPVHAGQYALLSLVGKIVYFAGSLLSPFIVSYVSFDEGQGKSPLTAFYKLLGGTAFFTIGAWVAFGPLGGIFIPMLFGAKTAAILPLVTRYNLAMVFYTLSAFITSYHTTRKQYSFSVVSFVLSLGLGFGITLFHADMKEIAQVFFYSGLLSIGAILIMHSFRELRDVDSAEVLFANPEKL